MADLPQSILDALEFEKSLRVAASVLHDPFYQYPSDTAKAAPGTLLKVEKDVDTKSYLLLAGTTWRQRQSNPLQLQDLVAAFPPLYQIALQGHVVIATDYAGLSGQTGASGAPIMHEYLASPS
ncbi:MAG: hypothetical protein Q9214_002937 [Letrouitia sp. 1 TL-2023]